MKYFFCIFISFIFCFSYSQKNTTSELSEKYREDQFYASITYNLLSQKPDALAQNGFSSGFSFGFIRDMPINKDGDLAIGIGLGLSSNSYNQNLAISEENRMISFNIIDEDVTNVSKNKFTTYLLELPIEWRWRTSTVSEYSFWRIYTGFKLGYLIYNSSKLNSRSGDIKLSNIDAFNSLQYGLTLSVGYSTWNFHLYYGLNPIFNKDAQLEGNNIDMKSFRIGLMFYIL